MAYQYTKKTNAGAWIPSGTFAVGDVMQYAGNDYIWVATYGDYDSTTSSMNYLLANGHITHLDGSTTAISDPNSATYLRSFVADVTLTDKTKAFAIGIMSTVNAIIAKVNTLTGRTTAVEGRVTAVEALAASKAAIADADADLTSLTTTLSASKIGALDAQVLASAKTYANLAAQAAANAVSTALSGVDGTQLAALNALSAALAANDAADGVITNDLLNKVDFSKAQSLTDAQAAQARANIKVDAAVSAALLTTVGDVTAFDPAAILATALTLN